MKYTHIIILATAMIIGCGREQLPTKPPVADVAPIEGAVKGFPKTEWTDPTESTAPAPEGQVISWGESRQSGSPTSPVALAKDFKEAEWRQAPKPEIGVYLDEHNWFRIFIDPKSNVITGKAKITEMIEDGLSVERTRTTEPIATEDEALALLQAFLVNDGSFDKKVQWKKSQDEAKTD